MIELLDRLGAPTAPAHVFFRDGEIDVPPARSPTHRALKAHPELEPWRYEVARPPYRRVGSASATTDWALGNLDGRWSAPHPTLGGRPMPVDLVRALVAGAARRWPFAPWGIVWDLPARPDEGLVAAERPALFVATSDRVAALPDAGHPRTWLATSVFLSPAEYPVRSPGACVDVTLEASAAGEGWLAACTPPPGLVDALASLPAPEVRARAAAPDTAGLDTTRAAVAALAKVLPRVVASAARRARLYPLKDVAATPARLTSVRKQVTAALEARGWRPITDGVPDAMLSFAHRTPGGHLVEVDLNLRSRIPEGCWVTIGAYATGFGATEELRRFAEPPGEVAIEDWVRRLIELLDHVDEALDPVLTERLGATPTWHDGWRN